MTNISIQKIRKEYNRLKKLFEKSMKKKQALPQLVLQPVKNRSYLRDAGRPYYFVPLEAELRGTP